MMKLFARNPSSSNKNRKNKLQCKLQRAQETENPSVLDYHGSTKALRAALAGRVDGDNETLATATTTASSHSRTSASSTNKASRTLKNAQQASKTKPTKAPDNVVEWEIKNYDQSVSEPLTMEEELRRLQVLQSYLLLDSDTELEFDRLTSLVSKVFRVPIALISLVDLGRQWFFSAQGVDVKETPRKHAFCSHVILNVKNIMVVPDATQDARFCDNPLVTGAPKIRFYAGAALVSPEGYKLGTVCIIDDQPRFLKKVDQQILQDFAAMAMTAMVERRNRLLYQTTEREQLLSLAQTCWDVAASLETVQQGLISVQKEGNQNENNHTGSDDAQNNKNYNINASWTESQRRTLAAATAQVELNARTCRSAVRTCRATTSSYQNVINFDDTVDAVPSAYTAVNNSPVDYAARVPASKSSSAASEPHSHSSKSLSDLFEDFDKIAGLAEDTAAVTNLTELYDNLNRILDPLPRKVPVTLELRDNVPLKIIADDLLVFRSALNLLSASMERTTSGFIHLTIAADDNDTQIVFECEDTGPPIGTTTQENVLVGGQRNAEKDWTISLSPMISMVNSLGGDYGFKQKTKISSEKDDTNADTAIRNTTTSVAWFAVPLLAVVDVTDWSGEHRFVGKTLRQQYSIKEPHSSIGGGRTATKTKVVVDDPFQVALIADSCLSGALEPTLRA